jgi:6,7-dimethyl-8-ribityllumazine synthase
MATPTSQAPAGSRNAQNLRIGIVTAKWNYPITSQLEAGALRALQEMGCAPGKIKSVYVPGAFEIPLAVQALLESGFDGVVALGCVIRGETSHYDYVCNAVERGCSEVQLKLNKPVGFGILTTENEQQALDRVGGKHGHKGEEAAQVVIEMINLLRELKNG